MSPSPPAPRAPPRCQLRSDVLDPLAPHTASQRGLCPADGRGCGLSWQHLHRSQFVFFVFSYFVCACVCVRRSRTAPRAREAAPSFLLPPPFPDLDLSLYLFNVFIYGVVDAQSQEVRSDWRTSKAGSGHHADPSLGTLSYQLSPWHRRSPRAGQGKGTPPGWAPPAYCSTSCSPEQAGESTCPSLVALAEGEAAPDTGAVFALLDPREFGDFYKDLETSWWQHLALGLSEAQRDSPACINTGGSNDISLTSCHGCRSRNASSVHREGLQINQTKSVPVMTLFTCATLGRWLALSSSAA